MKGKSSIIGLDIKPNITEDSCFFLVKYLFRKLSLMKGKSSILGIYTEPLRVPREGQPKNPYCRSRCAGGWSCWAHSYLQIVADLHADLRQRDGHGFLLHLRLPDVQLFTRQHFFQPLQRLHMVGHDEDYGWFLMSQWHLQDEEAVGGVIVKAVDTL